MFATDACVKVPLFGVASPLRHSVAYVMAEGRFHHTQGSAVHGDITPIKGQA